jgi:hypothetical protein
MTLSRQIAERVACAGVREFMVDATHAWLDRRGAQEDPFL